MGNAAPRLDVDLDTLTPPGAATGGYLDAPTAGCPGTASHSTASPYLDTVSAVTVGVVTPTGGELLLIGSVFPIPAGATVFLGVGWAEVEAGVDFPMPVNGSIDAIGGATKDAPGAGGSYVYTLRKAGADTALVATISGASRSAVATGSVAFAAGQMVSVKVQATGSAPATHHSVSLWLTKT